MKSITPFLWYDGDAEAAAELYITVFPNSRILGVSHYGEGAPRPAGTVMIVTFELNGHRFQALNGGPAHQFTEAMSFLVSCESQEEVDSYWAQLSAGGEEGPCGWLKDRFGLSWQIVPTRLGELLSSPDADAARRTLEAMLQMRKLDVAELERAAAG